MESSNYPNRLAVCRCEEFETVVCHTYPALGTLVSNSWIVVDVIFSRLSTFQNRSNERIRTGTALCRQYTFQLRLRGIENCMRAVTSRVVVRRRVSARDGRALEFENCRRVLVWRPFWPNASIERRTRRQPLVSCPRFGGDSRTITSSVDSSACAVPKVGWSMLGSRLSG
ncbi:hypothetical protein CYV19_15755 [Natronobacterium gregoryi SP2]|uniref:Uncharacterized protein n=1 Tax=Natronobacterium gregoryi (strain ATCC 43098 / DSM 3393 / CCM 3738 / CIP 104747 / IAM 13177 / JCM 8860 / NBRC 102187 / NCIMB 2189 / SP2) TaxID=797304 RepID=L9XMQ1_NATGS|nr:hypothetical protein C490_16828 [Natronobacterium gregoryi SP2]PLK19274.1 hypothetical protein CYV19_15755 [Natronobacterium gregoryi SP2]